jgi:hypothetical protein
MSDWHTIRAEYVAGGISLRKLSEKYDIPFATVQKKCFRERWTESRENAKIKVAENVIQKTAEKAADIASISKDIERKLLLILDDIIDSYTWDCTEYRENINGEIHVWKLTDITKAYRDIAGDIPEEKPLSPGLQSLCELIKQYG